MKKIIVKFTGVKKKWAKRQLNAYNAKWVKKYKRKLLEGILILKEENKSRLCDYKKLLKHRALVRLLPG